MTEDLENCPFCGKEARMEHSIRNELNSYGFVEKSTMRFRVTCTTCGCATPWRQTEEGAVSNWNRRTHDKG